MATIAVAGDCATTTALAVASAWPSDQDTLLVEADPTGGDLAAWLDVPVAPSLSAVVTSVRGGGWSEVEHLIRDAAGRLRLIPAPAREGEAAQAVNESARHLAAMIASLPSPVSIVDTGSIAPSPAAHPFVAVAAVTIIVHRQATQSAAAAAVRLQRLADQVDAFAGLSTSPIVAVVGAAPFSPGEIERFLVESVAAVPVVGLPVDELAAAVLAGRTGVSARRLARLPLLKAGRDLAAVAERALGHTSAGWPADAAWEGVR